MPRSATSWRASNATARLKRVAAPVSPHLEITEIHTRLLAEGGPAVLFEHVAARGWRALSRMPVLTNLFGTVERVALAMDRDAATSCARWARRSPS